MLIEFLDNPSESAGRKDESAVNSTSDSASSAAVKPGDPSLKQESEIQQVDIDEEKRRKLLESDAVVAVDNKSSKSKKKRKRVVSHGRVYVRATKNNTFVTVTDTQGNVLSSKSAGQILDSRGSYMFKGAKKSTPYAGGVVIRHCIAEAAQNHSIVAIDVLVHGIGQQIDSAMKNLIQDAHLAIRKVTDITPIAYNGTRAPVQRTP